MAPSDSENRSVDDVVELGGRFEIITNQHLGHLDTAGGKAYAARSLKGSRMEPYAIVCGPEAISRTETIQLMRAVETAGLQRMLDAGVVDWPDGSRKLALILEKPGGRRLMENLNDVIDPMPEDYLTRMVIEPARVALSELSGRGITHGSLRPTNMFYRDITSSGLMFGECISSPCGFSQPALFETIERALCQPSGKGLGSITDDLYALGVTMLVLLLGRNPVKHIDDETFMQMRIERGSYPALVGTMRLSFTITEPLRGLLTDDLRQRWTLNDLDLWLNGRRLSPKQPQVPRRAVRPFEFNGEEYLYCRTLSRAFGNNPTAAAVAIDTGDIDRWLRRSINDENRANAVASAIETAAAAGKGPTLADRLVSRVCMALDPPAPIRYKRKAVMLDGIGTALIEATLKGGDIQAVGEIFAYQLPMFWVNMQTDFRPEFVPLVHTFDMLRAYLEIGTPGLGIERALYELNLGMPCIGPTVVEQFPLNPQDLLRALDIAARKPDRPKEPIDRHIAAFLCARNRRFEEVLLAQIMPNIDPIRRVIAMLHILGETQRRYQAEPVPHLCEWVSTLLKPAIDRYRNRPLQDKMRKQIENACREGRILGLAHIVDNAEQLKEDQRDFERAKREYQAILKEVRALENTISGRKAVIETTGRQTAAFIASIAGGIISIGIVFFYWFS